MWGAVIIIGVVPFLMFFNLLRKDQNESKVREFPGHRLVTTIAYQWAGTRHYALEGSIFVVGAAVKWLRDALGIIASSAEAGELAAECRSRASRFISSRRLPGLARRTGTATRAAPSPEYARHHAQGTGARRTRKRRLPDPRSPRRDVFGRGGRRRKIAKHVIRVDGGLSASDWSMQFLADILGVQVDRPIDARNHRARRGPPRGLAGRPLSRTRQIFADLAARTEF